MEPEAFVVPDAVKAREASRTTVLVVEERDRAALLLVGKDRSSWLNGLVTADLAKRRDDEALYALLVEKKGKIRTDLTVVPSRANDALALAVPSAARDELLAALDHYLIMEDAELTTTELVFVSLHGPRAWEIAQASQGTFLGTLDVLGKGGAVVAVAPAQADALRAELRAKAEAAGGMVADEATWEAVRIAAGVPRLGREFDTSLYPQEASLESRAVSFSKGCYLGQEVVYMLENRGHVKKKLVPLDVDGDAPIAAGASVVTEAGDAIGDVRSATLGDDGRAAAIAMVKWAHAKPGTALVVDGRAARVR